MADDRAAGGDDPVTDVRVAGEHRGLRPQGDVPAQPDPGDPLPHLVRLRCDTALTAGTEARIVQLVGKAAG
ncbi:hypothetical protein [Streptomyces sp. NPDC048737]|uniref:hypothetical protein n=1 Tax=unclassified Streptomyces TaxID=2593676 RepID=UPI00341EED50